jgi:hypothetical protein
MAWRKERTCLTTRSWPVFPHLLVISFFLISDYRIHAPISNAQGWNVPICRLCPNSCALSRSPFPYACLFVWLLLYLNLLIVHRNHPNVVVHITTFSWLNEIKIAAPGRSLGSDSISFYAGSHCLPAWNLGTEISLSFFGGLDYNMKYTEYLGNKWSQQWVICTVDAEDRSFSIKWFASHVSALWESMYFDAKNTP